MVIFYEEFFSNYRIQFCRSCAVKAPFFNGVEVDLFKLYNSVTQMGGWQKVTNHERWHEVLQEMDIDEEIQTADHGLRQLYMRFLSKYECSELGNDNDDIENELITSRGRIKANSAFAILNESPAYLNRIPQVESNAPDYAKIIKSLLSGLPNEVNFAINVCTLASHPGPYLLRLEECPSLITVLVAHCCVFADGNYFLRVQLNVLELF